MWILFDFVCGSCKVKFESLEKRDTKTTACKHCGAEANRVISPVNFDCGGGLDPDFPTAYEQWGKKRNNPKYKPIIED